MQDLPALRARVREAAGLDPPPWLLAARVGERARARGLAAPAYLARLDDEPDELWALISLIRVGETRFFRHAPQLALLARAVLPERAAAAAREGRPLRAWSAGCATGEEAWTLALLLDGAAPAGAWEVVASDIDERSLATARRGRYPAARAAEVPEPLRGRAFVTDGAEVEIAAPLRKGVRFVRHNLADPVYPGRFDLILCRNVLIYFDAAERHAVLARLHAALRDEGALALGYSESLRDDALPFAPLRLDDAVLFRRAPPAPPPPARPPQAPPPAPAAPAPRAASPARHALQGDYADGARLAAELRPLVAAAGGLVDLDGATFLGDEAARVLVRAVEAAPGLRLFATRPPILRWLARHGLGGAGG